MSDILRLPVSGSEEEFDYYAVKRVVNMETIMVSADSRDIQFEDMCSIVKAKTGASMVLYDNDNKKTLFVNPIQSIQFTDVVNEDTIYDVGNNSQSGDA